MKKLLIVLIAVLTLLAVGLTITAGVLLASPGKQESPAESQMSTLAIEIESSTEPETTASQTTVPEVTEAPAETVSALEEDAQDLHFHTVDRQVYAAEKITVRVGPDSGKPSLGTLLPGDLVNQIAEGDKGWSKIRFKGQEGYVKTDSLTTRDPGEKPEPEKKPVRREPGYREVSDTIESTGSLHVRSGPGTDYKSIGYLKKGMTARRVAVSDNGWSKIKYEKTYGYVSNQYIKTVSVSENGNSSTSKAPAYQIVDEVVYSTASIHLRSGPGTNYKAIGYLQPGDSAKRTAVGDNGWSRVRFQKGEAYAKSEYLTTSVPGSKPDQPAVPNPEQSNPTVPPETQPSRPQIHYEKVDQTLVASQELTIRSGPGEEHASLGTLSKGSLVHRIAISDNGWSVILLSGKQVFVKSRHLEPEKAPETRPTEPPETTSPSEPADKEEDYKKVDETVITTDTLNVRSGPGTEYTKLGKLSKGSSVRRTAVGYNGWSRIIYKEKEAYVNSAYVKAEEKAPANPDAVPEPPEPENIVFEKVDETVYSLDELKVRSGPGLDFEAVGSLFYGDSIQRIGIGNNGWSKVLFDGKEAYAYSKYLTAEEPEMPDFGDTTTPEFPTPNSPFIYQYWEQKDLVPFAIFEPASGDTSQKLPLIISLHGSAEVGKDREFMEGQHLTKVFREWEYTKLEPIEAYIVCPHINKNVPFNRWGTPQGADAIFKLIDHLKKNYNIDENRIILEGHSMGGQGAIYIAADDRACFSKLVIVSGEYADIDYNKISIPVFGCVGGGMDRPADQRDAEGIRKFMTTTFKDKFKDAEFFEGPYNHDNVAIAFFQKDDDLNHQSDIVEWMLKETK